MPLLKILTNIETIPLSEKLQVHDLGANILSEELGKSLDFVVVILENGKDLSFGGDSAQPASYMEIKNVGSLPGKVTDAISFRLCSLCFDLLGISMDRCYLEFQESERHLWGWNGKTFAK